MLEAVCQNTKTRDSEWKSETGLNTYEIIGHLGTFSHNTAQRSDKIAVVCLEKVPEVSCVKDIATCSSCGLSCSWSSPS